MRQVVLAIAITIFCFVRADAQTASDTLSISFSDYPLELILDKVAEKTGYSFSYNSEIIPSGSLYSLSRSGVTIQRFLDELLVGTGLEYSVLDQYSLLDKQVVLRKSLKAEKAAMVEDKRVITLTGWVRDHTTKEPIVGANVYLKGTTMGAITDAYGNYRFGEVTPGNYDLIFSHITYESLLYPLDLDQDQAYVINGLLVEKIKNLRAIEVVSARYVTEKEWPRYYRTFMRTFFGNTPNATKCSIENPDVINLSYDKETEILSAESTNPIEIVNKALGYKVFYDLVSFKQGEGNTSFYGNARFEKLFGKPKAMKKWRRNRVRSFNGSINHFMRSLVFGKTGSEGFKIYKVDNVNLINIDQLERVNPNDIITSNTEKKFRYDLDFEGYLLIVYERELENTQYLESLSSDQLVTSGISSVYNLSDNKSPGVQKSIISLNLDQVTIDRNGQILEPLGISTIGYWAWERMSEELPSNYEPKEDNL